MSETAPKSGLICTESEPLIKSSRLRFFSFFFFPMNLGAFCLVANILGLNFKSSLLENRLVRIDILDERRTFLSRQILAFPVL